MGNGIEAVSNTQQAKRPGILKRVGVTYFPWQTSVITFGKELVKGKNIYDAGKQVKENFGEVHRDNMRLVGDTFKKAMETIDEHPELLVLSQFTGIGFLGHGIKAINSAVN